MQTIQVISLIASLSALVVSIVALYKALNR